MKKILSLLTIIFLCCACNQSLLGPNPDGDPVTNFEYLWNEIDAGYGLFPEKTVNWDSIYTEFRPLVSESTNTLELFQVMDEMLYHLEDGHVNLVAPFDYSRNWEWYLGHPVNFDLDLLERNYWNDEEWRTGALINHILRDSIGYIYYGSFQRSLSAGQINFVLSRFRELKGLVLDLRNNGGGSLGNAVRLASRFTTNRHVAYYSQIKTGPGQDDFSDPVEAYIEPAGDWQYTLPVVVLINRSSYSATTFFAAMMKHLPQVILMGDRTGGGGGLPVGAELPNGWALRYSATRTYMIDGASLEAGIEPEVYVDMDSTEQMLGVDSMLERALDALE